jgi:hypothetical protein
MKTFTKLAFFAFSMLPIAAAPASAGLFLSVQPIENHDNEWKVAARYCPSGLVWRERFDGDTVCVLPGERDANRRNRGLSVGAASACPSGLVWRERFDGDTVCVTPLERDENRRRRGL